MTAADKRIPTTILSLDISAAFDTFDHIRLLVCANELFGFDGMVLDLLRFYLSGREQLVAVDGSRSSSVKLSTGMPQGSVLGPLPFYMFTTSVGSLISSFGI